MDFMETASILGLSLVACVGGGVNAVRNWSHARHMQDTPASKIRSAAQGYVELSGVLKPSETPLLGPLTEQPCLWWRYEIERYTTGRKSNRWVTVEEGSSKARLRLDDGTGEVLIDPRGAEVFPASRRVWEGVQRHPLRNKPGETLLDGLLSGQLVSRYRYTEERLHAGEALYAIGHFQTKSPADRAFNGKQARNEVVREWQEDFDGLLRRFDANGNGWLEDEEWERVNAAASAEAKRLHRKAALRPAWHKLHKPGEKRPFVLSSSGKAGAIRRMRRQALIGALMCLLGACGLAWLISRYL